MTTVSEVLDPNVRQTSEVQTIFCQFAHCFHSPLHAHGHVIKHEESDQKFGRVGKDKGMHENPPELESAKLRCAPT
jgi:hypothetical protein